MYAKGTFEFDQRPIEAQILLKDSSRSFGCQAVKLSRKSLLLMAEHVRQLPEIFLVALHPGAEPRPCSVAWRRGSMMRVMMLD